MPVNEKKLMINKFIEVMIDDMLDKTYAHLQ